MEEKFWNTRAGKLTIALIAVLIAFGLMTAGVNRDDPMLYVPGLIILMLAMLYAPAAKLLHSGK